MRSEALSGDPRSGRKTLSHSEIDEIVAELRALSRAARDDSHPAGRDALATRALELARSLTESLAGWAVDHRIGLAVNEVVYEPLDLTPAAGADDSRHEFAGAGYDWSNASVNRRALTNLLMANPGAFPEPLVLEAALGLESLDLDQTQPIFERRNRTIDDIPFTLAVLRLHAIEHKLFFQAAGGDPDEAERKVADAYAVDMLTLREWEIRLPYLLGQRGVSESFHGAETAGSTARRLGLPLCQVEVRKRDEKLRSDGARHVATGRELIARMGR